MFTRVWTALLRDRLADDAEVPAVSFHDADRGLPASVLDATDVLVW